MPRCPNCSQEGALLGFSPCSQLWGGPFPTPSPFLSVFPAVPADTGLPPPVPVSKVGGKLIFNWVSRIAVMVIVPFLPSAALMINTPGSMSAPARCLLNSPCIASSDIPANYKGRELPRKHRWAWAGTQDGLPLRKRRRGVKQEVCAREGVHWLTSSPGPACTLQGSSSPHAGNILARLLRQAGEIPHSGHSLGS